MKGVPNYREFKCFNAGGYFGQHKKELLKPEALHMGTHLRVLSKSYPMNTNMTGFNFKNMCPFAFDESSLSIWKV